MRACTRCRLAETRRQVVTYRGSPRPRLLFVGEAPGAREDALGQPFVGRSGKVLDQGLASIGLDPSDYGITNVVMCRPPGNRFDTLAERACAPWMKEKVAVLDPRALVTLGAHALAAFLPDALPVSQATGRSHTWQGRPLFPLLHPAATFRGRRYQERWARDLEALRQALPTILGQLPPSSGPKVPEALEPKSS